MNPAFDKAYATLNPRQKEAVDTTEGPLLVVAGPGTGKTQLLALRVANIIKTTEASASNILCLTYTDNGAINMRQRLVSFIGQDAYRVGIFTFHSFCNSIITSNPEHFYNATKFSHLIEYDRFRILTEIFKNLPYNHPLDSYHPKAGFSYLNSIKERIRHIKGGGYTPEEYLATIKAIEKEYPHINEVLTQWPKGKLGIKMVAAFDPIIEQLSAIKTPTAVVLSQTLRNALRETLALGKTKPIGDWRDKYLIKEDESFCLKDSKETEKHHAVADLYNQYSKALYNECFYDFDDMILEVAHALLRNGALRERLANQYQYILVDEFQDTNEVQMSLIKSLTSSQRSPNVMVVGDDDQAIYKFQGAEISNIIDFRTKTYSDVKTVVLDTNYRSHQSILDFARNVVTRGTNRLELRFPEISKELKQGNTLATGEISVTRYNCDIEEYTAVASNVKRLIEQGIAPKEIAILSRNHRELKLLLPYLDEQAIPYEYTKRSSVFDEPHIRELVTVLEYLASINAPTERKDYLLPEILSCPYFNIPRATLFDISLVTKDTRKSWVNVLSEYDNDKVRNVYELIGALIGRSKSEPIATLLDFYMTESGFKEHYFGESARKKSPSDYVHFLAALKTLLDTIHSWREGADLTVEDVVEFINCHKDNEISLICKSPFVKGDNAVQIMAVHSAKGLEFEVVCLVSTHEKIWTRAPFPNIAPIPLSLKPHLNPAGDDEDDFIRLFYVALTRAKRFLYITGNEDLVPYLNHVGVPPEISGLSKIPIASHENAIGISSYPFTEDEKAVLKKLLVDYKLSATHLYNFLNLEECGPEKFIEQNLLWLPQPVIPAAAFGSAIHDALTELVRYPKQHGGDKAPLDPLLDIFRRKLKRSRLESAEHQKLLSRGEVVLGAYYQKRGRYYLPDDLADIDMRHDGVTVGDAVLTGKLDFLRSEDGGYTVIDYKTGKYPDSSPYGKVKAHKYKQQMLFYKILIEGSVNFRAPINNLQLEFVESITDNDEPLMMPFTFTDEEVSDLKKLIQVVYRCIVNLDFPDVSGYERSFAGMVEFERVLIDSMN